MLQEVFTSLLRNYTNDTEQINVLWCGIEYNYSKKNRHYHTLQHLEHLFGQLLLVKDVISDWNTVLFTLFYHDVIYNPLKSDNEEKSADLAAGRLGAIVPAAVIAACKGQILATKKHLQSADQDTNYFTDADLSVLGQDWQAYLEYAKNVRKEYAVYPDILYYPGRKKVLRHFLSMDRIFKTGFFSGKYEQTARENIKRELEME